MNAKVIDNQFLEKFPNGFDNPMWNELGKKHNPNKIFNIFNNEFSEHSFKALLKDKAYEEICEIALKLVKTASVVSVFEKVAFTNFIKYETTPEFCNALFNFLYAYNDEAFETFVLLLAKHKNQKNANAAKWPIVSFFKSYQDPDNFVLVKPNTVKAVAKVLDYDISYQSYPNVTTYNKILEMVKSYKKDSSVCKDSNLMLTQAVLFTVLN